MKYTKENSGDFNYVANSCITLDSVSDNEVDFWNYVVDVEEPARQNWQMFVFVLFEETYITLN